MEKLAEEYDYNQLHSPDLRVLDDVRHSQQKNKRPHEIDWTRLIEEKEKMTTKARQRGITIGHLYAILDQKELNRELSNVFLKPSKKPRFFYVVLFRKQFKIEQLALKRVR